MKDYESVAGNLNVSHLMMLSQTESNIIMRVGKHPNGPTLHFKVDKFTLQKQVKASQKRPYESQAACKRSLLYFRRALFQLLLFPFFRSNFSSSRSQ
jgi:hypothetical protein